MKYLIELSLVYEALPLTVAALLFLFFSIAYAAYKYPYYKSRYPLVFWLLVFIPFWLGLSGAEQVKQNLPVYKVKMKTVACLELQLIDIDCTINVVKLKETETSYRLKSNTKVFELNKCDIFNFEKRLFVEYQNEFERFYDSTSLIELVF